MTGQDCYVAVPGEAGGLYRCTVGAGRAGPVRRRDVTPLPDDPTFVAAHPDGVHLYAVHEVEGGGVTALRREDDGSLTARARVDSGADGPVHCSVHPSGAALLVAHYTGGAVSLLPITDDGRVDPPADTAVHEGRGADPERQASSHPHSVLATPDGRHVYVPDLGTDEVVVYKCGGSGGLARVGAVDADPGAGPRHLAVHPAHDVVYVANELDSTVAVYERAPGTGALARVGSVSTVPGGYDDTNYPGEVAVHPSGRWLYVSNRGHDSVARFAVAEEGRQLRPLGHRSTGGRWPRHFAIAPDGRQLLVANRRSGSVVPFDVDPETGALERAGDGVALPEPTCCCWVPPGDRR